VGLLRRELEESPLALGRAWPARLVVRIGSVGGSAASGHRRQVSGVAGLWSHEDNRNSSDLRGATRQGASVTTLKQRKDRTPTRTFLAVHICPVGPQTTASLSETPPVWCVPRVYAAATAGQRPLGSSHG